MKRGADKAVFYEVEFSTDDTGEWIAVALAPDSQAVQERQPLLSTRAGSFDDAREGVFAALEAHLEALNPAAELEPHLVDRVFLPKDAPTVPAVADIIAALRVELALLETEVSGHDESRAKFAKEILLEIWQSVARIDLRMWSHVDRAFMIAAAKKEDISEEHRIRCEQFVGKYAGDVAGSSVLLTTAKHDRMRSEYVSRLPTKEKRRANHRASDYVKLAHVFLCACVFLGGSPSLVVYHFRKELLAALPLKAKKADEEIKDLREIYDAVVLWASEDGGERGKKTGSKWTKLAAFANRLGVKVKKPNSLRLANAAAKKAIAKNAEHWRKKDEDEARTEAIAAQRATDR